MFLGSIAAGYVTFAVFSLVILTLFIVFNPDYSSKELEREPFKFVDFLRTFWVNPVKHPDFFWAFTGRLLLYTGYFAVTGYQFFMLTDYFGIDDPGVGHSRARPHQPRRHPDRDDRSSGPLSDKLGRRKPFVFASSAVTGAAFVLPWVSPDLTAWMIMTFIAGLGFGMFQAVDTALMSEVLPSAKSFAKDLGVVNIAATLPQTLAPGVAGAIVLTFGYAGLFPVAIVLSLLGAFAVWPIKAVK